jgi:hypothetical protein
MHTMHLLPSVAMQPNLELKTRPKQLLGSLPLVIALPECVVFSVLPHDPHYITVEDRLGNVKNYLKPEDDATMLDKNDFMNIPERLMMSSMEIIEE